jgi:hypothetical protein
MRKVDEIVPYLSTFFPKSFSTMVDQDPAEWLLGYMVIHMSRPWSVCLPK